MKKVLTAVLTAVFIFTAICSPLNGKNSAMAFTVINDAQAAVEKNRDLLLELLKKTEITNSFTKDDLENLIFGACEYSADNYVGTAFEVQNFRLIGAEDSKAGYMSADILIYQDDGEVGFAVKKEIPALSGSSSGTGDITVSDGNDDKPSVSAETAAAEKKEIEAAKKAISAAIWEFDVSNNTSKEDIVNMAKSATGKSSKVTITINSSDFKLIKASSTVEGSLSATLTLSCGSTTVRHAVGKTVPLVVTEYSVKINEDRSAASKAIDNIVYTNKTTKEDMLKVANAAVKNGSKLEWKDNFVKKDATFREDGEINCCLIMTLGDETRETWFRQKIPMLVRKIPNDSISVNKYEWEVLRIVNVERAKEGREPLSMISVLQEACNIRENELLTVFTHTRPNGSSCFTAIPNTYKFATSGENIYRCVAPTVNVDAAKAMDSWMNSPGHRANILKSGYNYIGVGTGTGEGVWSAVQLFAGYGSGIKTVTTSAGTMNFADEEAMQKEYLICTTTDGLVSYMPLDVAYMTKVSGGYTVKTSGKTVAITIGGGKIDTGVTTPAETNQSSYVSSFKDVKSDAYYADAVKWAVEKNITTGTSDTTFSPTVTCTRAQILTFLWRAVGSPKSAAANPFSDVKSTDYFYDAAIWASEKGMVSGNKFEANTPCTRSSTVKYLWQNAGSPDVSASDSFSDVPSGSDYAKAVAWAVQNNVTSGTSAKSFSPSVICDRGQIVTFLNRAIK